MLNTANAVIRKLRRSGAWTGSVAPAHSVRVAFDNAKSRQTVSFSGPVTLVTFGSEPCVWINDGLKRRADPDNPPCRLYDSRGTRGPSSTCRRHRSPFCAARQLR